MCPAKGIFEKPASFDVFLKKIVGLTIITLQDLAQPSPVTYAELSRFFAYVGILKYRCQMSQSNLDDCAFFFVRYFWLFRSFSYDLYMFIFKTADIFVYLVNMNDDASSYLA